MKRLIGLIVFLQISRIWCQSSFEIRENQSGIEIEKFSDLAKRLVEQLNQVDFGTNDIGIFGWGTGIEIENYSNQIIKAIPENPVLLHLSQEKPIRDKIRTSSLNFIISKISILVSEICGNKSLPSYSTTIINFRIFSQSSMKMRISDSFNHHRKIFSFL